VATLAQTSMSFRRLDISARRFRTLGPQIDDAAERTAREIYGEDVEVDVVLEAGSLRVRISVIGSLLILGQVYDGISHYKDFRESIILLVEDGQRFGSAVYREVLKVTGEQKADRFATKDMTPGRIARVTATDCERDSGY
jgi:hypothetical protein